jgi:hypothetical protein
MSLRLLAIATVVIAIAIGPATAAVAADAPSLTVAPNSSLVDGQQVTVTSSGLLAFFGSAGRFVPSAFECAPQFPATATFDLDTAIRVVVPLLAQFCVFLGEFPPTQSTTTSRAVNVLRSFTPPGGPAVQCGVTPGDCLILTAGIIGSEGGLASAPITFAPGPPHTTADCANGGWQHVARANGKPFKNQGRCISYVRHHHA